MSFQHIQATHGASESQETPVAQTGVLHLVEEESRYLMHYFPTLRQTYPHGNVNVACFGKTSTRNRKFCKPRPFQAP